MSAIKLKTFASSETSAPTSSSDQPEESYNPKNLTMAMVDSLKVDDRLLHVYTDGLSYEANIAKIIYDKNDENDNKYILQYKGWGRSADARLTKQEILDECYQWTKEDAAAAARIVREAQIRHGYLKDSKSGKSGSSSSKRKAVGKTTSSETPVKKAREAPPKPSETPVKKAREAPPKPSLICFPEKLQKLVKREYEFPPKMTIDKAFAKYTEKLEADQKSPLPHQNVQDVMAIMQCITDDTNAQLPELLTKEEIPEYFRILNEKRLARGLAAADMNDYVDKDDEENAETEQQSDESEKENSAEHIKDEEMKIEKEDMAELENDNDQSEMISPDQPAIPLSEIILPMTDSMDMVYFLRFIKEFNADQEEVPVMHEIYRPLFDDILEFLNDAVDMELYKAED